ncbi:hypothetical protein [Aurantimonas sp. 22II-16-19i]|uniref:hypothetical protein n=1 Tax=Aurantimonas sp. 22II-16-19i TaxID=1317114 RepID=UPI00111C1E0D|nr:hypothetical protein [Aurantimonas sp. 22II-16-19i]
MPSAVEWEDWCLETFFLNAAVDGRIDAIEIDDGKIIEYSGAHDLEGAHRQFLSVLPPLLDDYLKGEVSPSFRAVGKAAHRSLGESEARPNFVRILIFFLWLQITVSKDKDEGDIRKMATAALGRQSPQDLVGLHNMWIALARWLKKHRDILLELPDHGNETHVGITKRLAFPTKKDLDLLRRVRDDGYSRTDLRSISRRIAGDSYFDRTSPAFRRAFESWRTAANVDEEAARELPFMSAWTRVLAEKEFGTSIVLSCDEFGEIEVQKILADGRSRTLQSDRELRQACRKLSGEIAKAAGVGMLTLQRSGLASWIVSEGDRTGECLISEAALGRLTPLVRSKIQMRGEVRYLSWRLCNVGQRKEIGSNTPQNPSLRFVDKVRVGARGTYLGRWPMTPRVVFPGGRQPVLLIEGQSYESTSIGDRIASFPPGVWNGPVGAQAGSQATTVTLRGDAYPHADEDIRYFDRSRHLPEDGIFHDTQPKDPDLLTTGTSGSGIEPDPRLIALQEALYARSARTMTLQAAVDMASRVASTEGAPDVWALVRLFVDSGWFDLPYVSQVPARTLVQRRPSYRPRKKADLEGVSIEGPMPVLLEEAIRRRAGSFDLTFERNLGLTAWSLPKLWVGSSEKDALQEFLKSSDLEELRVATVLKKSNEWSDIGVGDDFERTGTWDSAEVRFGGNYAAEPWPRFVRMDRPARDTNARYVVEHDAGQRETFGSANLALLRYLDLREITAFEASGDNIRTMHQRHRLPSAWARWLATVHLRNCALEPSDGGWACVYPASPDSALILSKIYPALRVKSNPQASESGILPWMERTRVRLARDRRPIWHDGKLRAIHDLSGLRTCSREPRETR